MNSARLECYRNWQAIEGISNAKIAEPDFHYMVIDEFGNISNDVVTVVPGKCIRSSVFFICII